MGDGGGFTGLEGVGGLKGVGEGRHRSPARPLTLMLKETIGSSWVEEGRGGDERGMFTPGVEDLEVLRMNERLFV